ncbi:importin subunit alpha-4 isoform X2 [Drosophila mauritiana]|uniref:Importin subunit alpha n=2 Tax=Drosophila mauritiana TaxID=7226 RepID=A0A6P8K2E7_DROMA|nr:importin subunit alpha-4 isoform X2 [Drosophila mauritiana]
MQKRKRRFLEKGQNLMMLRTLRLEKAKKAEQQKELTINNALTKCKLTSSEVVPDINNLLKNNTIGNLVESLGHGNKNKIRANAADALAHIASGSSEHSNLIAKAGAVPRLIRLIQSPDLEVSEMGILCLGNLLHFAPNLRDFMITNGVVQKLISIIQAKSTCTLMLSHVTWVLRKLCISSPTSRPDNVDEIAQALNVLLYNPEDKILEDALMAVRNLAHENETIPMLLDLGVVPRIIYLLEHPNVLVQNAALQALINIASGSEEQIQELLNNNLLPHLSALMSNSDPDIRCHVLRILQNVADGNTFQRQAIMNAGLLHKILECLKGDAIPLKSAAALTISTLAINKDKNLLYYLMRQGVIPELCNLLLSQETDIIYNVLDMLSTMLDVDPSFLAEVSGIIEWSGALNNIRMLQSNEHEEIAVVARKIISSYFPDKPDIATKF